MVLKPVQANFGGINGFRSLQTYMVLKPLDDGIRAIVVLDPYKLTWFSNQTCGFPIAMCVLDPYKLTWFSNF